ILLVEDNPDDAELTVLALRNSRIANEIVVARDGAEALDYLLGTGKHAANPPGLPAVVILDLNLPKVPGIEVLKRIRATPRTALLPVVVLTTSVEDNDVLGCYRNGCNAYVQKPVSFDEFLDAAGKLGLFWMVLNVRPPTGQ
ncbi:MAG: response regulator, partial [Burkholderiales bacterium]|nr:response regulator [Burkholderiales bacterium]